jgi:hypothetical protein
MAESESLGAKNAQAGSVEAPIADLTSGTNWISPHFFRPTPQ